MLVLDDDTSSKSGLQITSRWAHNPQVDESENGRYATCCAMDFKGDWDEVGNINYLGQTYYE